MERAGVGIANEQDSVIAKGFWECRFDFEGIRECDVKENVYIKRSVFEVSPEALFDWHEREGAMERLTPPWVILKNIRRTGGIREGARVGMIHSVFGIPVPMEAEHMDYLPGRRFRDRLIRGPFRTWDHTHTFFPAGRDQVCLEDRVRYAMPIHLPKTLLGRLADDIDRIFDYRHFVTREDGFRHNRFRRPLTVVISGAGGVLGTALIPFLTTGGHRVIRLVRRRPRTDGEHFWDPYQGILDLEGLGEIDAVINLNGSHIGDGRWTPKRRSLIIESRNRPTELLAKTIASLKKKPELFLSASATGYYGDTGSRILTEDDPCGSLFISRVCRDWEKAAAPAHEAGVRTVLARIGVVLTPAGGALQRMFPAFLAGLGVQIAEGDQYMSWISIDDLIYSLYHIMSDTRVSGPVNIASPNPVTSREFSTALARVLNRQVRFTMPRPLIWAMWGRMGMEVLVAGTRVRPEKLLASGYSFCHTEIRHALENLLGKTAYKGRDPMPESGWKHRYPGELSRLDPID